MAFLTDKYPRISHFPFSPGAKNDDRIAPENWYEYIKYKHLIYTEKLDGSNSCIRKDGVYGRTHAVTTHNEWDSHLWTIQSTILNDLGDLELFGENMYAVHSIEYERLPNYFFLFSVRENGIWKNWNTVKYIAEYFNLKTVPEYSYKEVFGADFMKYPIVPMVTKIKKFVEHSHFGSIAEGVVVRNADEFKDEDFEKYMLKYVRANHVQTDEHWTKHWKKAKLYNE